MASHTQNVRFQPQVSTEILQGVREFSQLVRPTLGPLPRSVLLGQAGHAFPRPVDSGGKVARHLLSHPYARSNLGLQFAAAAIARLHTAAGDGTASAAVMLESLVSEGQRVITAGANAMLLRSCLDEGRRLVLAEIDRQRQPLSGKEALTRLACTISQDLDLSRYLGEIFDVIGEFGRLEIRESRAEEFEREYVDGLYWDKGILSTHMANQAVRQEAFLENPAVFITNYYLAKASVVVPVLESAVQAGFKSLLFISTGFSQEVIALLVNPANQERIWTVAVEHPVAGDERIDFIEDLAAVTGAIPLLRASDLEKELEIPSTRRLKYAQPENFGKARRVWATTGSTGLSGGGGDRRYLRHYIGNLRRRLDGEENEEYRNKLRVRLSRLMGGSATLWVGASNPIVMAERKETAGRVAEALRGALREGSLPGGGAALLAARAALEKRWSHAGSLEERAAFSMLLRAVEEPTRCLLANAGLHPDAILAEIRAAGPGAGYDVLSRRVTDMRQAGILDAAAVVKASFETALSAAASALTTDSIVRSRRS